jgi:hypothetical protein
MARTQFNVFKRLTSTLGVADADLYKTPAGKAGIILTAQAANIGASTKTVSMSISGSDGITTELAKAINIPAYDARSLILGKIVLADGDTLLASETTTSNEVKLTVALLETVNS